MKVYDKWNSNPVIISFSPYDAELSSVPFPSVTICNMNQAKRTEAEIILANGTTVEKKLLNDVCNGNEEYPDSEQYSWQTLKDFLIRVGSPCTEMLKMCEWSKQSKPCTELFNNYLTDEGLCCSFNRLPPNITFRNPNEISVLNQTYTSDIYDWDPEKGFSEAPSGDNVTPKRPLGAGAHLGLTVVLDAQVDNYYCSSTNSVGFKILLANPIETPKMADFGTLVSPGVEARFSITPSVKDASDSLRHLPIEKRRCYFANERHLMYYRRNIVVMTFYFESNSYDAILRNLAYDDTDFVANCGGLLGVFLGFSILSLVEMAYYVIWKASWIMYKNRRHPRLFPFIN